jgi:ethanolamine ammonia-lyase large subunit
VVLVLYGMIARQPISQLWLAGIIPGLLMAFFFVIYVAVRCRQNPELGPPFSEDERPPFDIARRLKLLANGLILMQISFVIMGMFLDDTAMLVIPYESDEVTRLIFDSHDAAAFAPEAAMSIGQFRDWLLRYETDDDTLAALSPGITPVDLVFQSIAGTQAANESFGINLALLAEAREAALSLQRGTLGDNVMYFETGQGSCLSAAAHHGLDQQTCEARAYAVARAYSPLFVNTVVGFIGPEYLYDGKQVIRAGLDDHFCGKLLGLPMVCDIVLLKWWSRPSRIV